MYAKLICALLISAMLLSCNRNAKEQTFDSSSLTPLDVKKTNATDKESNQKIPIGNQVLTTDSVGEQSQTPPAKTPTQTSVQLPANNDWNKKIIKTATVKLEVKNFKNYNELLYNKVKQYGGYIAQETDNLTNERSEATVSIKVPVLLFDGMMNDLTNVDEKVLEKNIKTDDVTGETVDTKARLEAKKQMRLKYLDFLKESKNMSDVLQVQGEIDNIQEEIEAASGRYASLTTQAAYSTIDLTFYQPAAGYTPVDTEPGFAGKTATAFKTGAAWIANLFIGMVSIWPLLICAVAGIYFYKKRKPVKNLQQNV